VLHAFLFHSYVAAAPAALFARVPVLVAGRRSLGDCLPDRLILRVLARIANRCTDHVIANADAVADDARRVERIPASKITTVYNGIPDSAFEPAPAAALVAEAPVILCVANLIWYKGHRHLLEAVSLLRDRGVAGTLVLVGDGPERRELEDLARVLALDIRFLGFRTDVESLLTRADVCVLPSLTEGLSNAVMEAMAAGKPIVATEVGGTGEPPADAGALADGLARVLEDPVLAARLGAEARHWSRTHLSVDAMVDRHVDLYRKLLEDRCAG
jgi:glycosyltransferase involved in cell wall biosynthesis